MWIAFRGIEVRPPVICDTCTGSQPGLADSVGSQALFFKGQSALIASRGARKTFTRGPLDEPNEFRSAMHAAHERQEGLPVADAAAVGQL